ncbi:helix-turn-helix domain-containing protein [Bacillus sp. EB106-08-02-XG196]|uniref:helix-turn-helix domain-containing protein n=1 Tax=Bacillus sp. EB106-08-02-XG196 TaxID=2737049 RepID=UPI0015C48723|nr:helix-turn-helix domain-containing protein [Bacillus sp. EB106-08-02-XG196]NWQ39245.1 helix-turn-helix domain-containing protein [Bacillus sp. EB106-08-02-XG196]
MEFGPLVKYYRTQKGITQKELAAGICSIPHLSKIENNSKDANEETISLLLGRLEVSFEEMEEKEELIKTLLRDFGDKINFYLREEIEDIYQKLKKIEHVVPFSAHMYLYELYKYRYLLFKGLLSEAEAQRDLLHKQKKNFSQHERYLFHYYNAVFLLYKGHYKKADKIFDELFIENNNEPTNGEFLYHWTFVKSSLDQPGHAIHFGRLALQIFMNQHNFYRILHTLMLLGINYTNSKIYEEAQVCFNHLIRNAELLKEERMLPQIYHNMGYLQDKMNNVKEALTYYEKSLSLQPLKNQNYLVTLYGIGEINYKLSDMEKAKEYFLQVKDLSKETGIKKQGLLADFYLIHMDSPEKAMKYLEVKVIPYLEGSKEHKEELIRYYKLLSEHYNQQGKYMQAVNYLSKIT